jgi:hypothetical protein
VARHQLSGGVAEIAAQRPPMRIERRARSRDGDSTQHSPTDAIPGDPEG